MKKVLFITILLAVFGLVGCNEVTEMKTVKPSNIPEADDKGSTDSKKAKFTADFKANPTEVKAGEQTELSIMVKNEKGEVVKDLQIVHEKPLHLLVVSEDLSEYYHIHPTIQTDGSYKIAFSFPNGGNYKLYADFTPQNSTQTVETFMLKVSGNERAKVELKADEKFEKTVDGLKFVMKPDSDLVAGKELMLNFIVSDAETNKPVTNLEKYLGEYAHFVIISQDLKQFVHAHPMSKTEHSGGNTDMSKMEGMKEKVDESKPHTHDERGITQETSQLSPSEVAAHTTFPQSGLFKIFAQFQRNGKVITVPFVVNVKESEKNTAQSLDKIQFPSDAKRVVVSKNGYEPSEVSFKKGEPMKIAFYRADEENCGGEIVFKDLNIKQKLPVGEVVLVDLKDLQSNTVSFSCGMNMMQGKVTIQ